MNTTNSYSPTTVKCTTTLEFSLEWWWGHTQQMSHSPEYALADARHALGLAKDEVPYSCELPTLRLPRVGRAKEQFSRYFHLWSSKEARVAGELPVMLELIATNSGITVETWAGGVRCVIRGGPKTDIDMTVSHQSTLFSASIVCDDSKVTWAPTHPDIPAEELRSAVPAALTAYDTAQSRVDEHLFVEPFGPRYLRLQF